MIFWDTPYNMDRRSHSVFLQKQSAWPFRKLWIILDKHRFRNTAEHLFGAQAILGQFIVAMLRYTNIARKYQGVYFLEERIQVPSSISADTFRRA